MSTPYIQIHWTCASLEEARKICTLLVEKRVVACAHMIPEMESVFLWKGKIDTAKEVKVVFKTKEHLFEEVKKLILQNCSYEVPEILKTPILDGHAPYLKWIDDVVA